LYLTRILFIAFRPLAYRIIARRGESLSKQLAALADELPAVFVRPKVRLAVEPLSARWAKFNPRTAGEFNCKCHRSSFMVAGQGPRELGRQSLRPIPQKSKANLPSGVNLHAVHHWLKGRVFHNGVEPISTHP